MCRLSICQEIQDERAAQDGLWGGAEHDDALSLERWVVILTRHLGLGCWDGSPDDVCHRSEKTAKYDPVRFRKQLVILAAVTVAALESFDRRHPPAPPLPDEDRRGEAAASELWDAVPSIPPHGDDRSAGFISREGEAMGLRKARQS